VKPTKQTTQLPNRLAVQRLSKGDNVTILDYAKASPIKAEEQQPTIIQTLRKPSL
jgi:hypothetical protein